MVNNYNVAFGEESECKNWKKERHTFSPRNCLLFTNFDWFLKMHLVEGKLYQKQMTQALVYRANQTKSLIVFTDAGSRQWSF